MICYWRAEKGTFLKLAKYFFQDAMALKYRTIVASQNIPTVINFLYFLFIFLTLPFDINKTSILFGSGFVFLFVAKMFPAE